MHRPLDRTVCDWSKLTRYELIGPFSFLVGAACEAGADTLTPSLSCSTGFPTMRGSVLRLNRQLLLLRSTSSASARSVFSTRFTPLSRSCSSCRTPSHQHLNSSSPKMPADAGAWGAWQVEPSTFTKLVVDSMQKLYNPSPPSKFDIY